MSKTIKRNVLIVLFAVVATFSLAFSFVFKNAKAEESSSTVSAAIGQADGVVMRMGASARLTRNETYSDGLREIVTVTSDVYKKLSDTNSKTSLQVWFTTAQNFETAQNHSVELLKANSQVCEFKVNDLYPVGDLYYGNAVLTNLSSKNQQDLQFVAIGVLATTTDGKTTYQLGRFEENDVANNTRSLYERVNAAFLCGDDESNAILANSTYNSWYGKDNHPIMINTQEDYSNLIARAKNNNLSNLTAIKKSSDTFTGEFATSAYAPSVKNTVQVTVKANGKTTVINVLEKSDITSKLNGLKPADTDDKYFDSWSVEGEGSITNVASNITVNAVMNDYLTITVVDKYNTENENATIKTIGKVKEGDLLADYINKTTFASAAKPTDASHRGYIVTPNGSEASKVSSLDNITVSKNTTISLWMALLQNIQVNVKVEAYKATWNGRDFNDTKFPGWVRMRAANESTYLDKSDEFTDLPQVTGYEDEKIDLAAFMAKLPEQYKLNTTAALNGGVTIDGTTFATNQDIVEGENSIDIYLDANVEVLGFSLTDLYIGANMSEYGDNYNSCTEYFTLTRRENGDVGAMVFFNASAYNSFVNGIGILLPKDVDKQHYSSVEVESDYISDKNFYINIIGSNLEELKAAGNFSNGAGDYLGKGAMSAAWGEPTQTFKNLNGDIMKCETEFVDCTDVVFTTPSAGNYMNATVFLKSITYSAKANIPTDENTTMDATELKKYVRALSKAGTFSIVEDGDTTALRYTATEDEVMTLSNGWGIGFYFNDIDITKFESIKVTFKMAADYSRNIRFDVNDGSVGLNFNPALANNGKICTLDVLNLPDYNGTGGCTSNDYTNFIKNGTPITSIRLSTAAPRGSNDNTDSGFTIDVYSIEFVIKKAETPQA